LATRRHRLEGPGSRRAAIARDADPAATADCPCAGPPETQILTPPSTAPSRIRPKAVRDAQEAASTSARLMKSTPRRGGLMRRRPADGGTAPTRIRTRFGYCLPICISLLLMVAAAMKGTTTPPPPHRWRAAPYLMVKDDALPPPPLAAARVEPMAGLWQRQGGEGCPRWRRLNRRPSRLGLGDAGADAKLY
jgi:hypothetical protein